MWNTYAFVKFFPIFVGSGVGSALIFGIHSDLGWVLASKGSKEEKIIISNHLKVYILKIEWMIMLF